jgi:signal transduction histidine kinase
MPDTLIGVHAIADALTAAAFLAIPAMLLYVARRRRDPAYHRLATVCAIFVLAAGVGHVVHAWNLWSAALWPETALKAVTAVAAVAAAVVLWRALPDILRLPSPRELHDANESLARANRELEAFTAAVSHDLRSPLTTIAGQAGLLELSLGSNLTEEQQRRLHRLQGSVKQMSELIEALLVLSRISRHTLHREIVDVSALAETVVADMRQKFPERTVAIVVQPGMHVHGDRRLLADMLTNLISNAWKFTAKTADARIDIGQSPDAPMATLHIRDNGAGFDMAYEKKLFKPFQRLHGAADFEGTGIGLATVARIVERHGGRIWAEAKPNEGAVFYFTLPTTPMTAQAYVGKRAVA